MNGRIKELRTALGLTQQEFADRISSRRNTIANYETGRNEPSNAVLNLICREFGVREEWLKSGEGPMFKPPPEDPLRIALKETGLTPKEQALVERFVQLPAEVRAGMLSYIQEVLELLLEQDGPEN